MHQRLKTLINLKSFNIAGAEIPLAGHVKILGTILDSTLTMDNHIKAVFKGKGLDACYSATYISQTCDQQRFTISEVAPD